MPFKHEEFVDRETQIAGLLAQGVSLTQIGERTGLSKKLLTAHLKNMMQKTGAGDLPSLIMFLKLRFPHS